MSDLDLVGVAEIAARTGRSKQTVNTWTTTTYLDFPQPITRLAGGPVWKWETILKWLQEKRPDITPTKGTK